MSRLPGQCVRHGRGLAHPRVVEHAARNQMKVSRAGLDTGWRCHPSSRAPTSGGVLGIPPTVLFFTACVSFHAAARFVNRVPGSGCVTSTARLAHGFGLACAVGTMNLV